MTIMTFLVDLSADECTSHLAETRLGRLGVFVEGRPEIFPVNHVFDSERGCVAFPTNAGTKMDAALAWPWVAFEVDGVEGDGASAWSVVVVGRAEEITDQAAIERLAAKRQVLWAMSEKSRWIRIVPSNTTGRRISTPLTR